MVYIHKIYFINYILSIYCATYIQAGQDLRVPLWYRAPLDRPRNYKR